MAGMRDRQSNMAYSYVNAQPAKGGAGGQYTWGSPTDVTDYVATGINPSGVGVQTMVVQSSAPVVVQASPYRAQPSEFPALGTAVVQPVQWQAPASVYAAPATFAAPVVMAAPPVVMAAPPAGAPVLTVREGVEFGQAHPRHHFATKPNITPTGSVVQAIDWSSGGMPTQVQSAIIQAGGGRAHGSPVALAQPALPVPLNVMRAQVAAAPNHAPTVMKSNVPPPRKVVNSRKPGCC